MCLQPNMFFCLTFYPVEPLSTSTQPILIQQTTQFGRCKMELLSNTKGSHKLTDRRKKSDVGMKLMHLSYSYHTNANQPSDFSSVVRLNLYAFYSFISPLFIMYSPQEQYYFRNVRQRLLCHMQN
jgi:hypothetical protein